MEQYNQMMMNRLMNPRDTAAAASSNAQSHQLLPQKRRSSKRNETKAAADDGHLIDHEGTGNFNDDRSVEETE